jgi:hypothetical protein
LEEAEVITVVAAAVTALLNLIAIYMGGRVEQRVDRLASSMNALSTRLERLTTEAFPPLVRSIGDLTGRMSAQLSGIEEKVDALLGRV